jgi:hypothetical protein|tara:strand:- start:70 stop:189 length:120 start_codon:yes stop_codon:yes gene_type:complete
MFIVITTAGTRMIDIAQTWAELHRIIFATLLEGGTCGAY